MRLLKAIISIKSIAFTIVTVLLFFLFINAASWQWQKGAKLANRNGIIKSNLYRDALNLSQVENIDPNLNQWQKYKMNGKFDAAHQLLVKNSYFEGKLGFEVLQLFTTQSAIEIKYFDNGKFLSKKSYRSFWIDRGWVQAGANAKTAPNISELENKNISITARIRSEVINPHLNGSFFATGKSANKFSKLENYQGVSATPFYFDLVSAPDKDTGPFTQEVLPDLSTGPHYAYAFQWILFALCLLVGRVYLYIYDFKKVKVNNT